METKELQAREDVLNHIDALAVAIRAGKGFTLIASADGGPNFNAGGNRIQLQHIAAAVMGIKEFVRLIRAQDGPDCQCGCMAALDDILRLCGELDTLMTKLAVTHLEAAMKKQAQGGVVNANTEK